jgi:ethanolamine ammonia-lyase large subunit
MFTSKLHGKHHNFKSLKDLMAKANEEKSGDRLAGLAAEDLSERAAAKLILADQPLSVFRENPSVPYESDEITRLIEDHLDETAFNRIRGMSVGEFREFLLDDKTTGEMLSALALGITPEMAAAVTKIMSNMDLVLAASKIRVVVKCNSTLGLPGRISSRLQTNDPRDSVDGIMAGIKEGLSYGTGDAVLGINPATESVRNTADILAALWDFIQKYKVPTQNCVLAHITIQMQALKLGAPVDLFFQSLSGTQKANQVFGINVGLITEAHDMILKSGSAVGSNRMYFETGQGTALSADAHFGTDQLTMEARAYGFARHYKPFLVNTVVGFIGPEYLYDAKQITRAGLEDHFMGKLMGLSMGVDDCYTNHAICDQNDLENLAILLTAAGVNFFMSLPMGDDIMLNYQSTSFHDNATVRELFKLKPTPEFESWLEKMGIWKNGKLGPRAGDPTIFESSPLFH